MQTRAGSKRIHQQSLKLSTPRILVGLDPKLWGTLPPELHLKIYNSMRIREFYQLRVVCKGWNRVACERRCFSDPIPKPYFVLIQHGIKDVPTGTLAYNASSGSWIWRLIAARGGSVRLILRNHMFDPIGDFLEPFAVEGILFGKGCFHPTLMGQCLRGPDRIFLFDVQAGRGVLDFVTFGSLNLRKCMPRIEGSTVGMMVDASKKPHIFKLILGSCIAGTHILDSQTKTWETKPSRMVRSRAPRSSKSSPKSCIACDGRMYIWADLDEIQVYSLGEDKWSTLDPPPRHVKHDDYRGLGHWQDEVYAVTRNEETTLSVWKLGATQEWSEFRRMPSDLCAYLLQPGAKLPFVTTHCNEYLLMRVSTHSRASKNQGRRYVLFNVSTKRWEIVDLPNKQLWK